MRRRNFVAGVGSIFCTGAISGCSALGGSDNEESEDEQPDNQEPGQDSEPNQGVKTHSETKALLVSDYQIAYEGIQSSKETLNTVFDSFENEEYEFVNSMLSDFESQVESFASTFEDAASAATELGNNGARQACTAGKNEAKAIGDAGSYIAEAADSESNGNSEQAQTNLSEAKSSLERAQELHQNVLTPEKLMTEINYSGPTM